MLLSLLLALLLLSLAVVVLVVAYAYLLDCRSMLLVDGRLPPGRLHLHEPAGAKDCIIKFCQFLLRSEIGFFEIRGKDCTPEIDTSEIIVDFQWHFPMDFHFSMDSHFEISGVQYFAPSLSASLVCSRNITWSAGLKLAGHLSHLSK